MDLALFDFDGTITREDSFSRFLRFAGRPTRLARAAFVLWPLVLGYKLRLVPARSVRARLSRLIFRGEPSAYLRSLGAKYARDWIPGLVRPEALARISWHKERGHLVVVVSASLDVYLAEWCRSIGVELICTELEVHDGTVTGEYVGGDCFGPEKPRRVRERYRLDEHARVYAYGDTSEDLELLQLADEAYYRWRRVEIAPRPARAS